MAIPSFKRNNRREAFSINNFISNTREMEGALMAARVLDVNINEKSAMYTPTRSGAPGYIGGIRCVTMPYENDKFRQIFAIPYFPFFKYYPLVGEIVMIIRAPSLFNKSSLGTSYYYLPSLNLFNNPSLNTSSDIKILFPDQYENNNNNVDGIKKHNDIYGNNTDMYKDSQAGIVFNGDKSVKKDFNPNPSNQFTFVENPSNPLKYYPGDFILEGRYGNSIRLGATANDGTNSWSQDGNNGDPITIINNGRKDPPNTSKFNSISENPNVDISSIYLTSNQKLPIRLQDPNIFSTRTKPTYITTYQDPQILLNSNRIVINAKTDSIIGVAKKTINLKGEEIGLVSQKLTVIQSPDIRLGNNQAGEPVLLGFKTIQMLDELLTGLQSAFESFKSISNWPGGAPVPNAEVMESSIDMIEQIKEIRTKYLGDNPTITSNTTRTT